MDYRNALTDRLMEAILSLESQEEAYAFFEDLLTISELKSLSQRLEVADMLQHRKTYQEIGQITGVSTATISRVNRALLYGRGGYASVLSRLTQEP